MTSFTTLEREQLAKEMLAQARLELAEIDADASYNDYDNTQSFLREMGVERESDLTGEEQYQLDEMLNPPRENTVRDMVVNLIKALEAFIATYQGGQP